MKITIFGAGKFGSNIAQALLYAKHDITVVDRSAEVIDRLNSRLDIQAVNINAKDIESLRELNIDESDIAIACMDNDDKNMVLCSLAKAMGVKRCIARVRSFEHIEHLSFIKSAMNIDYIMNPDYACALEMHKYIMSKSEVNGSIETINGALVYNFTAERLAGLAGCTLKESKQLLKGVLVAALSRNGNLIIPGGNTEIQPEDTVYVIGDRASVMNLRKKMSRSKSEKRISNVMIAGGGRTAFFLARLLIEENINVKIIENDHNRAQHLAYTLDKVDVVYGDATDQDLLFEEDFQNMDAFLACTGFDEENILLALMANKAGIENIAAKTSQKNYASIMANLGDIMIINPIELCTTDVIRSINIDKNLIFSKVIQGQAEFTELNVSDSMPIVGKSLSQIKLPEGVLITTIFRNGKIIIPDGSTEIQTKDRLIFIALLSQVTEIEKLIRKDSTGEF